ncbi:hypothetical protein QGP82_21580 [Leptothoe sp. LEGE 181152]|nr:hypothetical protein [Leptothoe sp. LEGE 181152]
MADPVTLTVSSIATLAFTTFLESSTEEVTQKLTKAVLEKINTLRAKIWAKLRGIPAIHELSATVEKGGQVTPQKIDKLITPYLEAAMKEDPSFAEEIRQLACEINQEINISETLAENVQNVHGGSAVQINDPKAPVIAGDVNESTLNFNINNNY